MCEFRETKFIQIKLPIVEIKTTFNGFNFQKIKKKVTKNKIIHVKGIEIGIISLEDADFISLTDMTKSFNEGSGLIGKWITTKNTLEIFQFGSQSITLVLITPNSV